MSELGPDSSIRELFTAIEVEEGCNVVPVRISKADDDQARLMICVCGSQAEANLIVSNLMTYVDSMYAAAAQSAANEEALKEDGNTIIVP